MKGEWRHFISYMTVATVAVCVAFLVALRFVTKSHSQEGTPPAAGAPTPGPTPAPTETAKPGGATADSAKAVLEEVTGFLEPFIYDAKNRRDPFQPYVDVRPIADNPLYMTPLQRYELSDFKLVGIMWDVHDPKAMFVDPDKQVHVVGRDESIGKKNGYIAVIREGEVVVVESSRNKEGVLAFKPTVLRIER